MRSILNSAFSFKSFKFVTALPFGARVRYSPGDNGACKVRPLPAQQA